VVILGTSLARVSYLSLRLFVYHECHDFRTTAFLIYRLERYRQRMKLAFSRWSECFCGVIGCFVVRFPASPDQTNTSSTPYVWQSLHGGLVVNTIFWGECVDRASGTRYEFIYILEHIHIHIPTPTTAVPLGPLPIPTDRCCRLSLWALAVHLLMWLGNLSILHHFFGEATVLDNQFSVLHAWVIE
jgi:hypothetical protein